LGVSETLLADAGYFSAGNVEACEKAGVAPLIAMGRQSHHPPLQQRFEMAPPTPESADEVLSRGNGAQQSCPARNISADRHLRIRQRHHDGAIADAGTVTPARGPGEHFVSEYFCFETTSDALCSPPAGLPGDPGLAKDRTKQKCGEETYAPGRFFRTVVHGNAAGRSGPSGRRRAQVRASRCHRS
jgi:hypothetical protein